ncbi:hypothetical protein GC173_04860, partial [bacterium]|nr:hypothetical protein [bacterium]
MEEEVEMRGIIAALALLGAAALSGSALGAETIAYQGRLASNSGGDPPSGTYLMQFSLFPFEGGGEPLWAETRTVPVEAGLYTVELGGVTPFADQLFAGNPNLWLETALDSSGNGVFETT